MERNFKNVQDKDAIKQTLLAECVKTETMVFQKPLGDEERTALKEDYVQGAVKFGKLKDDFDKMKEQFKSKMKPVEQLQKEQLTVLKTGSKQVEELVYFLDDQENKLMHVYDGEGNLILTRQLLAEERQMHINSKVVNG